MWATLNYKRIDLVPVIPAGWEQVCIRGSHTASWEGESGIILTETIAVDVFSLLLIRSFSRSAEHMQLHMKPASSYFLFCIEGQWQINGIQKKTMAQQGQYQLFYTEALELEPQQIPGRMSQCILINSELLQFCDQETSMPQPEYAPASILDLLLRLNQSSFLPQPRTYHKKLIHDIITMAVANNHDEKYSSGKLNTAELDALYKVSMLIEKDLTQHHSIAELAIYSGMNREKLTTSFKSLFGQTIYTYYLTKRMELAKNCLVASNLPIKLISKKVGYRSTTNFSIAFKKFYGITPAQMRLRKPD